MENLTANAATPDDLFQAIGETCREFGEVSKIRFLCRRRAPDEIVCFIHMTGSLSWAARALGGVVSGYESICLVGRLPETFRCAGRPDGNLQAATCYACQSQGWVPLTLLAAQGRAPAMPA